MLRGFLLEGNIALLSPKEKKSEKSVLAELFAGMIHRSVFFANYLLSLLISQELLSVHAFELFWSELLLIVP